jgi:alpha-1,3/alpha-1,6-mannosyltransferase
MSGSDRIVVNSKFTRSVAGNVFPSLHDALSVIYPCVSDPDQNSSRPKEILWNNKFKILLSINRFERKKDIGLAIRAFKSLTPAERKSTRLILAGGYDHRVTENVQYHAELVKLAEEEMGFVCATAKTVPTALAIPDSVEILFLLSVPGSFKTTLLENAKMLIYTPQNEHFGIVPVEAMQAGIPVLASNTGGPLETIIENETGWLRPADSVAEWTSVIRKVLTSTSAAEFAQIKKAAQRRVSQNFTASIMARKFDAEMKAMFTAPRSAFTDSKEVFMALGLLACFVAAGIIAVVHARVAPSERGGLSEFSRARRRNAAARAAGGGIVGVGVGVGEAGGGGGGGPEGLGFGEFRVI